jgi:hypothetical protein
VSREAKVGSVWPLVLALGLMLSPGPGVRASAPRTIALEITPNPVTYGDTITLTGRVDVDGGSSACEADVEVGVFFDEHDDIGFGGPPRIDWFEPRGRTSGDGTFSFEQDLPRPGSFWVAVAEDPDRGCDEAISEATSVGVRHLVTLRSDRTVVRRGGTVKLRVRVQPFCGYVVSENRKRLTSGKVFLEKLVGEEFLRVAGQPVEDRPFRRCGVVFRQRVTRTTVFRAMTPDRSGGLCCYFLEGWSEPVPIEVRA